MSVWKIDPAHTSVEFAVKHMMMTTVRGRFKELSGTISIDELNPDHSYVDVEIEAASVDTGAPDRDAHLRSPDFFDVEHYPKIRFRSKRIEGAHQTEGDRFKVVGDLTIRDTTLELTLNAGFDGEGKDPWGQQRAGFMAEGDLDRRDWGLRWNQAIETGGILVANRVHLQLEVQAVLESASAEQRAEAAEYTPEAPPP